MQVSIRRQEFLKNSENGENTDPPKKRFLSSQNCTVTSSMLNVSVNPYATTSAEAPEHEFFGE